MVQLLVDMQTSKAIQSVDLLVTTLAGTAGTTLESRGLTVASAVGVPAGGLLVVVGFLPVAAAVVGGAPAAGSTAAGRPAVDTLASWELLPIVAAVVAATSLEVGVVVQIFRGSSAGPSDEFLLQAVPPLQ